MSHQYFWPIFLEVKYAFAYIKFAHSLRRERLYMSNVQVYFVFGVH